MTAAAGLPLDAVVVGRVAGSYGVRGWLRIEPFNEPEESVLLLAPRWFLQGAPTAVYPASNPSGLVGAAGIRPPAGVPFALRAEVQVENCRVHGAGLVAKVAGVEVKEQADALRGCEVSVRRIDFPDPGEDEFYWVDLIGCSVTTPDGVRLGEVEAVDHHGAHPLLRLRRDDGGEQMIPFVSAHVLEVDVSGRRIVADWDPDF